MEPQVFAATPVAQATVQVIAVLLEPVTVPLNCSLLFVITLAEVGVIVMETPEELLPPQPQAPSAAARASIVETFHRLIPVLPKSLNICPRGPRGDPCRSFRLSIFKPHMLNFTPHNPQSKRPAHGEAERADWIKEIRPLRVVELIYDLRRYLGIPYIRIWRLGLVNVPRALIGIGARRDTRSRQTRNRAGELRRGRRDHFRHAVEVVRPINPERRLHDGELHDQFEASGGARLEIRARLILQRAANRSAWELLGE